MDKIIIEEGFENIKKNNEIEVVLKKWNEPVNGKVVENNLEQSYIRVNEVLPCDTTIKYDQIKFVEVF